MPLNPQANAAEHGKQLVGIRATINGEAIVLHPDDVEFLYIDADWVSEARRNLDDLRAFFGG